jgi:hypothetical protein
VAVRVVGVYKDAEGRPPMLQVVPAFSRIGDENAFAVLARATELSFESWRPSQDATSH